MTRQHRPIFEVDGLADLAGLHHIRPFVWVRSNETLYRWDYDTDSFVVYPSVLGPGAGIQRSIVVTSGDFTAAAEELVDYVYFIAGAHTPTLPSALGNENLYTFKNNHSAAVTIGTTGGQTINGAASYVLSAGMYVEIYSDNTNWRTSSPKLTVGTVEPTSPAINDLWVDTN